MKRAEKSASVSAEVFPWGVNYYSVKKPKFGPELLRPSDEGVARHLNAASEPLRRLRSGLLCFLATTPADGVEMSLLGRF